MRLKKGRQINGIRMEEVYNYLGKTRQGLHEQEKRHEKEVEMMKRIESLVITYRKSKDKRAGSRSLYHNLKIKSLFNIGVTKFERLMAENRLTLAPLRIKVVTTKSDYQSWNYGNLINGLLISNINQVVAGDLTYVFMGTRLFYVFSLMDLYSQRVVGMTISDRMRSKDALVAFLQWKLLRNPTEIWGCIHHTDGGSQYFSVQYLEEMSKSGIRISRAKTCLENGYAEQWNGLLKNHFIPTIRHQNLEKVEKEIENISYFYNYERKQEHLGWKTPVEYEMYIKDLQENKRPVKQLYQFESPKGQGFFEA